MNDWSTSLRTITALIALAIPTNALSQPNSAHRLDSIHMAPGAIGRQRVKQDVSRIGYTQPVAVRAPFGATVSVAQGDGFAQDEFSPVRVGLQVGNIYRFKVGNIPKLPGKAVYPTIEVVDRLHPPPGLSQKFPVPVDITQKDIEDALDGKFVTRVVFLEDPHRAFPRRQDPDEQLFYELLPHEDALHAADDMGRPMAIVRIGSRVPETGRENEFTFGSPPVIFFAREAEPIVVEQPRRIKDNEKSQGDNAGDKQNPGAANPDNDDPGNPFEDDFIQPSAPDEPRIPVPDPEDLPPVVPREAADVLQRMRVKLQ